MLQCDVVPTRKLPQGASAIFNADFDVLERTPSVGSHSSVNSFSSFRSGSTKSKTSTRPRNESKRAGTSGSGLDGSNSSREGARQGTTGEIIDMDEDGDGDIGNLNATGHLFDMLLKTVSILIYCVFTTT